ncbi:uncharacterized protein LOC120262222 [Dioscorea cayenensis subsp. rotundata]|uniref:Uncharacterized protein LOC120262222 n=1 Tax=Dioscorea cayennensis subsp. rotundata TaxID=55577 RepID=A0AB40BGL4_DIOCR|nr:uncharacterized protein LOC120262222 [Dioscorea cayenensis subsp. rotundata]
MAMLSFSRSYILFFVLFLLITTSSLILLRVQAENRNGNKDIDHGNNKESFGKQRGEEGKEQEPALVERAIGITGFTNRWDSIRNWFKLAWLNLRPPDSGRSMSGSSASDVMKEAATRSFETSKGAMEQAASSAANLAGEAVEKTKEKVKRTVSMPHDAEL